MTTSARSNSACPCASLIVLVCGAVPDNARGSRRQITEGIAAILPAAEKAGIKLAIEAAASRVCG